MTDFIMEAWMVKFSISVNPQRSTLEEKENIVKYKINTISFLEKLLTKHFDFDFSCTFGEIMLVNIL